MAIDPNHPDLGAQLDLVDGAPDVHGYVRVSSKGQDLGVQIAALRRAGVPEAAIVREKSSAAAGKDLPELARLAARLGPGAHLYVTKLDRLGRAMTRIVLLLDTLTARGVTVHVVEQGLTLAADRKDPMAAAMVGLLSVFAQLERDLVVQRLADGRAHSGNQGGRPRRLDDEQVAMARAAIADGQPIARVAKSLGVHRSTLYDALGPVDSLPEDGRQTAGIRTASRR